MTSISTTARVQAPTALSRAHALASRLPLVLVFAAAATLASVQSLGHRTPLVFSDELLYAKFSQSIAEGHGLSIWGVHQFFPSFLLPLVQSPVWLLGPVGDSYLAARVLNGLLMASAVFPASWLAVRLVPRRWALLAAAAAVALPELGYHDTLMAEPLAYPLFLLAAGAIVRAVADGGRGMRVLAVVSCALVALTRLQLAAVVIGYGVAAIVASPRRLAHALPLAVLVLPPLAAYWLWGESALGQYNGFLHLQFGVPAVLHWIALLLLLLPFSCGLAVLPGALLGLAGRPRNRAEAAFTTFVLTVGSVMLVQAAMISAADAQRAMTRYVFYLAPLLVIAFFLYVERGAPRRPIYLALTAGGGLLAVRIPFSSLTPAGYFDGDTPTSTVFATIEGRLGVAHGMLAIELGILALAALVAATPLRAARGAAAVAGAGIAVSLGLGLVYGHADHRVTRNVAAQVSPADRDWIDASRFGPVTYLSLPGSLIVPDSEVAFWNRSIRHVAQFSSATNGALPLGQASDTPGGRLEIDGRPNPAGRYVVGSWGSRVAFVGRLLGRLGWLTAVELPRGAHLRWLAAGLDRDGYSVALTYDAWPTGPARSGHFTVDLVLPASRRGQTLWLTVRGGTGRMIELRPGTQLHLVLPAPATPRPELVLRVHGSVDTGLRERGVLVRRISYARGSRSASRTRRPRRPRR
ncbi:MAG: hypothetical protein ABR569_05785 [Gaiellaceae bacterium]